MSGAPSWKPSRVIDRSSPIPFYYQLQEILKQEIEDRRWSPGDLLPSEAMLSSTFQVSRPVIRKALDILEGDGQVFRVRGKGTVVARPKFRYEVIGAAESWSKGSQAYARLHRILSAEKVSAGGHIGRILNLAAKEEVYEFSITHAVDDTPASSTHLVVRADAVTPTSEAGVPQLTLGAEDALSQLRRNFGLKLIESQLSIEATRANAFEADLLDIELGLPVFLISSLEIGGGGDPVAFSRTVVRSDQFQFSTVIKQPALDDRSPLGLQIGKGDFGHE